MLFLRKGRNLGVKLVEANPKELESSGVDPFPYQGFALRKSCVGSKMSTYTMIGGSG